MGDGLLITAAINGAETTREQHPRLPILPEEVGLEARRCADAGAGIIHLHGRLPDGRPTQDIDTFRGFFAAIRAASEVIVQFSTGGAVWMSDEERIAALPLRPEMASLTMGTTNFGDEIFANPRPLIARIARRLAELEIRPELEIFDVGHLDMALRLHGEGVLRGAQHVDFVMGVPGAIAAEAGHLDYLVGRLPSDWTWSVAGVGRHEMPMARAAIERGGHVRVGLEDNLFVSKGVLAEGSWELVEAVAGMGRAAGREPLGVSGSRALLGLSEVRRADA